MAIPRKDMGISLHVTAYHPFTLLFPQFFFFSIFLSYCLYLQCYLIPGNIQNAWLSLLQGIKATLLKVAFWLENEIFNLCMLSSSFQNYHANLCQIRLYFEQLLLSVEEKNHQIFIDLFYLVGFNIWKSFLYGSNDSNNGTRNTSVT